VSGISEQERKGSTQTLKRIRTSSFNRLKSGGRPDFTDAALVFRAITSVGRLMSWRGLEANKRKLDAQEEQTRGRTESVNPHLKTRHMA